MQARLRNGVVELKVERSPDSALTCGRETHFHLRLKHVLSLVSC